MVSKTGDIEVQRSTREPGAKLTGKYSGLRVVYTFAGDSNAYPGNEYWLGDLGSSADPAAAASSVTRALRPSTSRVPCAVSQAASKNLNDETALGIANRPALGVGAEVVQNARLADPLAVGPIGRVPVIHLGVPCPAPIRLPAGVDLPHIVRRNPAELCHLDPPLALADKLLRARVPQQVQHST